ncbi:unnamed protein product [Notodromas monacha]|uniref:Phosphatidylinositol N-acetylglucosaminyltransferase subunit H conserved domain-containing protein n=2 Tax=Notodromas monacha TaxID=399045 RepID=A0A7R9BK76_9CRUS|nr:unnamed protein product [Notodromas monacha]CAG0915665.1 unnamed protein product [Notodromas monacha]
MAKHHPDLIFCRKQPGVAIGRLCEKCDGKCVICDSYVRPCTLVRICDECNYGSYQGRCVICGGPGVSDAYYCKECTILEKDRDGCPKIVNLGSSKTDLFYERKKYGFKKRCHSLGLAFFYNGEHKFSFMDGGTKCGAFGNFGWTKRFIDAVNFFGEEFELQAEQTACSLKINLSLRTSSNILWILVAAAALILLVPNIYVAFVALCVILAFLWTFSKTVEESILAIPGLGYEIERKNKFGTVSADWIPIEVVESLIIKERIGFASITSYLAFVIKCGDEGRKLQPLFLDIRPRLDLLIQVYRELLETIPEPDEQSNHEAE